MQGCIRNEFTGTPCRATGGNSCDCVLDLSLTREDQCRSRAIRAQNISSN